jgi:hypothetical protein
MVEEVKPSKKNVDWGGNVVGALSSIPTWTAPHFHPPFRFRFLLSRCCSRRCGPRRVAGLSQYGLGVLSCVT